MNLETKFATKQKRTTL